MALTAADRPLGAVGGSAGTSDPGAIRVCVRDLPQIFNPIDPSPLTERDLNEKAERFIVSWARDLPTNARPTLTIEVSRPAPVWDPGEVVRQAARVFFARRAETAGRRLYARLRDASGDRRPSALATPTFGRLGGTLAS